MKISLYKKVCYIGICVTLFFSVTMHFFGIPFYMTGHLILPWIAAFMAYKLLKK